MKHHSGPAGRCICRKLVEKEARRRSATMIDRGVPFHFAKLDFQPNTAPRMHEAINRFSGNEQDALKSTQRCGEAVGVLRGDIFGGLVQAMGKRKQRLHASRDCLEPIDHELA